MTRTFVDAGVLIAAATLRDPELGQAAIAILDDRHREFLGSGFLRLEVSPKAIFHRRSDEVDFYDRYFLGAVFCTPTHDDALETASSAAQTWGLNAMDSLHVAAAIQLGADEFITTERLTAPIFRVTALNVVGLYAAPTASCDSSPT